MRTKVVVMTLHEYEVLRWRARRRFNSKWYYVERHGVLGTFFYRTPKLIVKLVLEPVPKDAPD